MQIEMFCLCDAATGAGGKLNVLGAFDALIAPTVPVTHQQCAIALRIRFDAIERGEHRIAVNIVDMDGKHVLPPANGTIQVDFPGDHRSGSTHLIFNMHNLKIEKYGEYAIDLAIDGRKEATLPLYVRPPVPTAG